MAQAIGSLDLSTLNNLYDETQYFWFESSAQPWGAGAHVTLYPQSEFTTSTHANYLKGQNILMNTDGFSIRNGTLPMMTLDNDSLDFNVIDTTNQTYTNVASFGTEQVVLWGGAGVLQVDPAFGHVADLFGISGTQGTYVGMPWAYYAPGVGSYFWCAQKPDDEDEANTYDQFVRIGARTNTGGQIGADVYAGIECVASYTDHSGYIEMEAENVSLSSSGDVEFQGDITAKGHDSPIGKIEAGTETTKSNSATATWVEGSSVELPNGIWVIIAHVNFAQNSTGRRAIAIYSGSSQMTPSLINQSPTSGAITHMVTTYILSTSGSTVSIRHYQTSGGQLSATSIIRAVRIR